MIPIKLEIEGLYSYKEKQTIDFTQLTAAGLFGIFGAVGSGKSSVLEAILLAIYGQTERLASKGEKYSMVNLQSQGVSVHFEFMAGQNNAQRYKASYQAKRNSKNFDDIKTATHNFYEYGPEGWVPLDANGEDLVGMKMSHFRQTVIIPQGKFREFIEHKPKDRAEMMKELFGLERFDLADRTRRLMNVEKDKKIRLETLLGGLEEYSKELVEETQSQLVQLADKKKEQEQTLSQKEKQYREAQSLKEKAEQLQDLQSQMKGLDEQLPAFQQKRRELSQYQTAMTYLKPLLDQHREQEVELEKYQVSVTDCERFKVSLETEVQEKEVRYQKLYRDYGKKGEKEARIRDLLQIKGLNKLAAEEERLRQELGRIKERTEGYQEKQAGQERQMQQVEKTLEALEVPELEAISKMEAAFAEIRQNHQSLEKLGKQLDVQRADLQEKKLEAKGVLTEVGLEHEDFDALISQSRNSIAQLEKERDQLLQKQGLFAYANQLQNGEPCPLCGALDHPEPLSAHFDGQSLQEKENQIQAEKNQLEKYQQAENRFEKLQISIKSIRENEAEKLKETQGLESRNKVLLAPFSNLGIGDMEGLGQYLKASKAKLQEEKSLNDQLKKLAAEHKQFLADVEKDRQDLQAIDQRLSAVRVQKEAKLEEVNYKDMLENYREASDEKIDGDMGKVKKYLEELEVNLPRAQDALTEARQKQATNLANLESYQQRLKEVKAKLAQLKERLSDALEEHGFDDSAKVQQLLESGLDPQKLGDEIKDFDRRRDLVHSKIQELQTHSVVAQFDREIFDKVEQAYQSAKTQLEETRQAHSLLESRLVEIKSKLEEKGRLAKDMKQVENRESNLKELYALFSGSGFVKYISNIYLKELVQTANIRFMKLAKNSLSLDVDESNTFWVQDHLNGGKKRLLKTLSGGQTFQASLCLALALAEKVKSLNRAEQSFFFLDEGFGALDRNALRTVFETLKSLRHENRVVGIISHVEDLQQEIGVFAQVELDPDKGSQVSYSY